GGEHEPARPCPAAARSVPEPVPGRARHRGVTSSRLLPPTALLVVAMLLAGCELLAPGASLDGRTFLSTAVVEDGQPRPLVPGTQIRLGFHDGRIAASAGCNTLRGTYR